MRINRLTAGLVTAGLVGFVPLAVNAPADAAPTARVASTTTLSIDPPSTGESAFAIGDTLFFKANVGGPTNPTTGAPAIPNDGTASLQILAPGSATWTTIATDVTPSFVSFSNVLAASNAQYKLVYSGGTAGFGGNRITLDPSESAPIAVPVARTLKVKTGNGLKVTGKVSPSFGKEKIKLLQKKGKTYKKFKTIKTNKKGKFTLIAPRKNKFKFAVVIPGNALYTGNVQFIVVTIYGF